MIRRVFVTGVAAISAPLSTALSGPLPPEAPLANPKARNARKMMSRGAYLAAAALGDLIRDAGWTAEQRELAGYFLGVGASGGSLDDVGALLDASIVDGAFSLPAFGSAGLAACNPLLAFQLMNNFTLAHGAIFEGLGGPNGALFSRGTGTTAALIEAVHAIASGDCDRAVAGGADSATHPVTRAELAREGFLERSFPLSEAAALLALTSEDLGGNVEIAGCAIASGAGRPLIAAIDDAVARAVASSIRVELVESIERRRAATNVPLEVGSETSSGAVANRTTDLDLRLGVGTEGAGAAIASSTRPSFVVVACWGPPALEVASAWARERYPNTPVLDTGHCGSTLAATPALGWVAAVDRLRSLDPDAASPAPPQLALVIDLGVDGDVGAVLLRSSAGVAS